MEAGSPELATVVVVPRERFSFAARSLESLRRHTERPLQLVYVDGGSPRRVGREIARICDAEGWERIRSEHYLTPNQARNLGARRVRTRYAVFVDNDVIVAPGWLEALVACAEETGAWIVGPLCCIGLPEHERIHMAGGEARIIAEDGSRRLHERHGHHNEPLDGRRAELKREECEQAEFHCMLVRMQALEKLGPLDEDLLCSREHVDLCLSVQAAGGQVWFEPGSLMTYVPGPPFALTDIPYYLLRWSDPWGRATIRHFNRKWRLADDPDWLLSHWIRPHRRAVFRPLRGLLQRRLGRKRGAALADYASRVVEAAVVPRARRKGGGNPGIGSDLGAFSGGR